MKTTRRRNRNGKVPLRPRVKLCSSHLSSCSPVHGHAQLQETGEKQSPKPLIPPLKKVPRRRRHGGVSGVRCSSSEVVKRWWNTLQLALRESELVLFRVYIHIQRAECLNCIEFLWKHSLGAHTHTHTHTHTTTKRGGDRTDVTEDRLIGRAAIWGGNEWPRKQWRM